MSTTPSSNESESDFRPLKISSRQVLLLNALDQYRNMRRAASAMHTTQPTASILLQQLESRLGVKLFERHRRGMEPTLFGEVLIRYAKGVSHDFEHAEAEIAELLTGALGFVRIGSVIGMVPSLLTERLLAFRRNHPRVRISIEVGTSDVLLPHLVRGDLDLVLGRFPDRLDDRDLTIDFFETPERMSVVARPDHALARKERISLTDLSSQTWILHPVGSPMRLRVESALKQCFRSFSLDIVETTSLLATTSLIESSEMISVVPHDVAMHYARYGLLTVLKIDLPISLLNLGIITKKGKILSPSVVAFLGYLAEKTREHSHPSGLNLKT